MGANLGTPILSAFSGVIVESQQHWSYGVNIVVESTINGKQYRAIYAHLQSENAIAWDVGQQVHAGEILGYVGMTGNTTGPHLHFEVREYPYKYKSNNVDPREFWEK